MNQSVDNVCGCFLCQPMLALAAPRLRPDYATFLRAHPLFRDVLNRRAAERELTVADYFLHQTEWIAITGASSSGKSSLITEFDRRGLPVRRECATDYFNEQKRVRGLTVKQLFAPERVRQTKSDIDRRAFFSELDLDLSLRQYLDRAVPDQVFFDRLLGIDPYAFLPYVFFHRCRAVFILERLPYQREPHRMEHLSGATDAELDRQMQEADQSLETIYRDLGYDPVRVPIIPVSDRADFILQHSPAVPDASAGLQFALPPAMLTHLPNSQ